MKLIEIVPPEPRKTKVVVEFDEDEFLYMVVAVGNAYIIGTCEQAGVPGFKPLRLHSELVEARRQL